MILSTFTCKTIIAVIFFSCLLPQNVFSQIKPGSCNSPTGYYEELKKIDASGTNPRSDTVRFHTDAATKNYILAQPGYYLTYLKIDDFSIPDPPANTSLQTKAEIDYLLRLQNQRSKIEIEICKFMAGLSFDPKATENDPHYNEYQQNLFQIGRSIGTWYNPENLPETAKLLGHVYQDAGYFIWQFKYKYARIRPYVIDPRIKNLEDTDWPAYPSGHAGHSYVTALVLSSIAPEFSHVFMKDAYDIAHSREIIGVHFPSDSEASRILACQLLEKLSADKRYIADLAKVRAEWQLKAKEGSAQAIKVSN